MNSPERVDWLSEEVDLKREGQGAENGLSKNMYISLDGIHRLLPLKQNKRQNQGK